MTNPTQDTTIAACNLLKGPGLLGLGAVFVLAAWTCRPEILMLSGLFLATAGLARLWSRVCLSGVRAEVTFQGLRFFPGQTIACQLHLINRKPLPLAWIEIENKLPAGLTLVEGKGQRDAGAIRRSASLLWYRSIRWQVDLIGDKRGYYPIGPMTLASGDLLGLYCRSRATANKVHLIVYPRLFGVDTGFLTSLNPMGDLRVSGRPFRDPSHTIGVRDYQHNDSLRFIHWKATARRGDLQVKTLAATTTFNLTLVLDVESFWGEQGLDEEDFELAISSAGSLAAALCRRSNPVGLLANTCLADTGQPALIAPGAGPSAIRHILETLAKVTGRSSSPVLALLENQKSRLAAGTTIVFILSRFPAGFAERLAGYTASGSTIMVLVVGDRAEPVLPPAVAWRRVLSPMDLGGNWPP